MYYVLCSKLTFVPRGMFGGFMYQVSECSIKSTWKELTSRAEITFPRNLQLFERFKVKEIFRVGDPVKIELGYNGQLYTEFTGYITKVAADIPVTIKLEDEMWKLKQIPVNYSAKAVTLEKLLRDICPGYKIDALEGVSLGSVRFSKTTVAKVLEKLKSDYNLSSYMKGKQLVCGKYYSDDSSIAPVKLHMERDLVNKALNYKTKEDITVKIKGTSILTNGDKIEVEAGFDGGDQLDLTYYNIPTKGELEILVKKDYEKRKQDGFDGTVTAFGVPRAAHGMKAELYSDVYPDRNGQYFIDAVEKTFGVNGYRQVIELGDKI